MDFDHAFFLLGLTFIVLHELDAVRCKEWRIFPGLSALNDKTGEAIFLLAHIPLFYGLLWYLTVYGLGDQFVFGFNVFAIVHFVAHLFFLKHPQNQFKDWISWLFIAGAALCGLLDLSIDLKL